MLADKLFFATQFLWVFMYSNALKIAPVALVLSFLTACGGNDTPQTPATEAQTQTQTSTVTYRVGVDAPYMPYVRLDGKGGYEGFDVDILNEIGKREGFALEYQSHKWDGIFDLLENKGLDIVASGLQVTDERQSKYGISDSHINESMVLIVPADSSIFTFADAKDKRVAYAKDSFESGEYAKDNNGGQALDPALAGSNEWEAIKGIFDKRADAAVSHTSFAASFAKEHPTQKIRVVYKDNPEWVKLAFATHKDNPELLGKINNGLATIKADGTYSQIRNKWFGEIKTQWYWNESLGRLWCNAGGDFYGWRYDW